ncbi:DMT family transporter [Helicobacter bilis]|uniref:Spermidine export protein MdtJ n=1 Tax=Helicobacter bilis TaxID=37372 RepID=A0A4U8U8R7_9HELI|nr:SMR family transporter [Helicobacter bilis]MCI7410642.1 SMR family transporter [Helicobacter bilis]MDD7295680.1 SMR family transporter [Helicobacter bilis]MDY4400824.1 SMR family transporter [Helicobacter bilis]TLE08595.1 SMR drug efflux transporter [Helicobacter bilis]TLE10652.1 SMR drug efflux transporter [Helicobacter bilis]
MQNAIKDSKETNAGQTRTLAWTFLIIAILLEVGGVAMLNAIPLWLEPFSSDGVVDIASVEVAPPMIAKAVMLSMIAASYYCMSLALRKIALGVAYSVWEIVGMIGILFISFLFSPPNLTIKEYIGIAVGFVGIICVILGEEHQEQH